MENKKYAWINGIMLVCTVVVNYLSNTGIVQGNTMKTVSDEYFTRFTPAGYAFSIWGVIYLSLACFVVYSTVHAFKRREPLQALQRIGWWFALSCLANMCWVLAWLSHYTLLSVFIMAVLLLSLLVIVVRLQLSITKTSIKHYWLISFPFSLYAGWISLAIIANVASLLMKYDWNGFGLTDGTWAMILIFIAGFLNVLMVVKRNMRAYGVVGIWGLLAVAANQPAGEKVIVYSCYGVALWIVLAIVLTCFRPLGRKSITYTV